MTALPSAPPPAGLVPITTDAPDDPWVGRVLGGRYRVLQRLAEGGMGTVYSAEHLTLHKQVALKLVHQADNADHARRFVREAMVTSRIDHPNVISAIDFGTFEDGTAYLAMQLVDGPTLASVLSAEGCLSWVRAAEIGMQISEALIAAQAHGIVHRDLKPDNVILQLLGDGSLLVKVLDFGIAKYARESLAPPAMQGNHAVTRIGAVIGTPGYMAPEQAVGKRADHRADLYSLGVLLWECVVGRRLWDFEDLQKLLGAQLNRSAPSIREASQDFTIPDAFDQLVARLLSQQASDRPSSAALVRDELRDLVLAVKQGVLQSAPRSSPRPPAPETAAENAAETEGAQSAVDPPLDSRGAVAVTTRVLRAPGRAAPVAARSLALVTNVRLELSQRLRGRKARLLAASGAAVLIATIAWGVLGVHHQGAPKGRARARSAAAQSTATVPPTKLLADPVRNNLQTAVDGTTREQRVSNAQALLRHVPMEEVPAYARAMARMQLAETCPQKKAELELFKTLDDPRTLPALVALSQRKRVGCGRRGHQDCLVCLRTELAQVIQALESKTVAKSP
jgi:tRNA A-37 threonylcarbamoyl transferase component Bud32